MHVSHSRASAKEIDPAPAQFAGARSRQKESLSLFFDESVHFIEKSGHLLDFVDDYGLFVPARLVNVVRISCKVCKRVAGKKVEYMRVRHCFAHKRRLSALAGTE